LIAVSYTHLDVYKRQVPTGFSREYYYRKELELKMSCSYGPGRYDYDYEQKGIDYPIGYVRWTENRNMQAFINLVKEKKIDIEKVITHTFIFNEIISAYNLILEKSVVHTGIVIEYDTNKNLVILEKPTIKNFLPDDVNVGFVGAGSFAQNIILPNLPKKINLIGVATSRGNTSKNIEKKYGFYFSSTSAEKVVEDKKINTIFITTRHNLHAEYVLKGLTLGKNLFVEKPLCMSEGELYKIKEAYHLNNGKLMLGFNRRFAPHIQEIKKRIIDSIPMAINYRINAGYVPKDHWTQDPDVGGGRIIGEVCHFIDLAMFISGSKIKSVYAVLLNNKENTNDTLNIQLQFLNGSIANISYLANGNKQLPKEYLEIFYAGTVYLINDFKEMIIFSHKKKKMKLSSQDKGHKNEITLFIDSIKNGKNSPILFEDIFLSTLVTFKVLESISTGKVISI